MSAVGEKINFSLLTQFSRGMFFVLVQGTYEE